MGIYTQDVRIDGILADLTDDLKKSLFDSIYPVGAIYMSLGTDGKYPTVSLKDNTTYGKWSKISDGYYLRSCTTSSKFGTTGNPQMPDVRGQFTGIRWGHCNGGTYTGVFKETSEALGVASGYDSNYWNTSGITFSAANYNASSTVYKSNGSVVPKSYRAVMWQRVSG